MRARKRVAQVHAQADAGRQALDGHRRGGSVLALAGAAGRTQPGHRTAMALLLRRLLDPERPRLRGAALRHQRMAKARAHLLEYLSRGGADGVDLSPPDAATRRQPVQSVAAADLRGCRLRARSAPDRDGRGHVSGGRSTLSLVPANLRRSAGGAQPSLPRPHRHQPLHRRARRARRHRRLPAQHGLDHPRPEHSREAVHRGRYRRSRRRRVLHVWATSSRCGSRRAFSGFSEARLNPCSGRCSTTSLRDRNIRKAKSGSSASTDTRRTARNTRRWRALVSASGDWKSAGWSNRRSSCRSPISARCRRRRRSPSIIAFRDGPGVAAWTACSSPISWRGADPCRSARYVVFDAFDQHVPGQPYYETIDLELARHAQTILAYDMNGAPLYDSPRGPVPPACRDAARVQDGEVHSCHSIRRRLQAARSRRGWIREDTQFNGPEAGI